MREPHRAGCGPPAPSCGGALEFPLGPLRDTLARRTRWTTVARCASPAGYLIIVHPLRRTITWIVAAVAWACAGSVTGVDRGPGGEVATIAIDPSSLTLVAGTEAPLHATARDESGHAIADVSVVWSVKDTNVALVSSNGVVSARNVGNTQIAASAGGVSAIATVAVQPQPVSSVLVQPLSQALVLGQGATFTATPRDVNGSPLAGRVVTWSSSNDSVATVSQTGDVLTHAIGSAS